MGLRIRDGRTFPLRTPTEPAVLLSERAARALWPGASAIGRRTSVSLLKGFSFTVLGVVDDVRHRLNQEPEPTVYVSADQFASLGDMAFVFTAHRTDAALADLVRQRIEALSIPAVVTEVLPAERLVERSMATQLLALRAVRAASLGVIGAALLSIFALVSTVLAGRRKEDAIRTALGMSPARLAMTVTAEWMAWACLAIAGGTLVLFAGDHAAAAAVAGVRLFAPTIIAGSSALVIGLVACGIAWPTYRAAVASPESALRIP
jgi:hypothetical protein